MNKKYFITGGGTGGHIYPAVAVADGILDKNPQVQIYYIGNPENMEAQIVKDKNYKFLPVRSLGMPRKLSFSFIAWSVVMFFAWIKCCYYVLKYKPDVIFATGGYVSAPVLMAGLVMKVPFVMHDCDANPGLVTKKFAPYAKSVSTAFEQACSKLNNPKCFVNGNPIRRDFSILTKEEAKQKFGFSNCLTLCIMGGSQGAKTINRAAIGFVKRLTQDYGVGVIFQTGKKNYDEAIETLKEVYPEFERDKKLIIRPYFDNMVEVLKASDIAISRAGSLSISELSASGVGAIFIPYPYAAADHQRKNARVMEQSGAGLYLEDSETNSETLFELIKILITDMDKLNQIRQNVSKFAKYDGVEKIISQIDG